ncbi:Mitogen-activated protein kinase kinase kinase 4 [Lucilia cuprina]|nr:Mitogen-activated protein kinase kinase kinase 4 [Lucilia cuprina]
MHTLAAKKFCTIIRNLLKGISERLVNRSHELDIQIDGTTQNPETELKWQVLTICRETQSLFTVERECSVKEQDRQAVLSRTREILHQGYKFGFEYHKDVIRLFEHRIMANKNQDCELIWPWAL